MNKPVVVVSQCLEFDKCRYNGEVIPSKFVKRLQKYVNFKPVCPEVEIGLGIPRDPIKIVEENEGRSLVQPSTGKDLTAQMLEFSKAYLNSLKEVDGFILKASSPSCGVSDVKIFRGADNPMTKTRGSGMFAEQVLNVYPGLAIEDEGRLTNFRIREHFLTKLFTIAEYRKIEAAGRPAELINYHTSNKLLFMAYNQAAMARLGRIVAGAGKSNIKNALKDYRQELYTVFTKAARHTSHINVLMHALGYFKQDIDSKEKRYFLDLLEDYREEKIPLSAVLVLLRSWIIKYDKEYLSAQRYFTPFPEDLIEITDSGKGRSGRY